MGQKSGTDNEIEKKSETPAEVEKKAMNDAMFNVLLELRSKMSTLVDDQETLKRRLEKIEKKEKQEELTKPRGCTRRYFS